MQKSQERASADVCQLLSYIWFQQLVQAHIYRCFFPVIAECLFLDLAVISRQTPGR